MNVQRFNVDTHIRVLTVRNMIGVPLASPVVSQVRSSTTGIITDWQPTRILQLPCRFKLGSQSSAAHQKSALQAAEFSSFAKLQKKNIEIYISQKYCKRCEVQMPYALSVFP